MLTLNGDIERTNLGSCGDVPLRKKISVVGLYVIGAGVKAEDAVNLTFVPLNDVAVPTGDLRQLAQGTLPLVYDLTRLHVYEPERPYDVGAPCSVMELCVRLRRVVVAVVLSRRRGGILIRGNVYQLESVFSAFDREVTLDGFFGSFFEEAVCVPWSQVCHVNPYCLRVITLLVGT